MYRQHPAVEKHKWMILVVAAFGQIQQLFLSRHTDKIKVLMHLHATHALHAINQQLVVQASDGAMLAFACLHQA